MCAQAGPVAVELVDVDASQKEVKSQLRVQATCLPVALLPPLALFSKERKALRSAKQKKEAQEVAKKGDLGGLTISSLS